MMMCCAMVVVAMSPDHVCCQRTNDAKHVLEMIDIGVQ